MVFFKVKIVKFGDLQIMQQYYMDIIWKHQNHIYYLRMVGVDGGVIKVIIR